MMSIVGIIFLVGILGYAAALVIGLNHERNFALPHEKIPRVGMVIVALSLILLGLAVSSFFLIDWNNLVAI